jgi:hypothetical protein
MSSSGIWKLSSYLTGNTLRLRYRTQPVNTKQDLKFLQQLLCRKLSSEMWFSWITDVSEERITSIIKVTRLVELYTTLAVTSNRITLRNVGSYKPHTAWPPRSWHSGYNRVCPIRVPQRLHHAMTWTSVPGCKAVWRDLTENKAWPNLIWPYSARAPSV